MMVDIPPAVSITWDEKVVMFQINPDAASRSDVARIAEELCGARRELLRLTMAQADTLASMGLIRGALRLDDNYLDLADYIDKKIRACEPKKEGKL